jgi:addiction module HigA family antidote
MMARENGKGRVWPNVAIPPGETLAEELEARNLTQSDLARRMDRPVQAINEIVRGKKAITAETALQLERVLDTPAAFWLHLEADYQLTVARLAASGAARRRRRVPTAMAHHR